MSEKKITYTKSSPVEETTSANFKKLKSAIVEMYKDDQSIRHNVNKTVSVSSSINTVSQSVLESQYYNLNSLDAQRKYADELYSFYPIYANLLDYLSNMYLWRYTYIPRLLKEKKTAVDYKEMYQLMGEVVDGLCVETTFPMMLTQLFIDGAIYLIVIKNTSSKTITTLSLPTKYCRANSITQLGTYTYQFDFSYFDSLGLNTQELDIIFNMYPAEMRTKYNSYLKDKTNLRWQVLDGRYAAAILCNKHGFPTKLNSIFSILQYDQYLENELERNGQQLDKIISHKMPTWEDKLVVDIDEMKELHNGMAKSISKNSHVKLLTTFGDMNVLSIGEDQSKENKTLTNAYNAIYDNSGENHAIFNGEGTESLKYSLMRDQSITWKYIQQLVNFYNVAINNSFSFKGYQCDFNILPITVYNEEDKLMLYKEGATLGVSKLEYIVSMGIKQVNLASKIELEDFLQLDKLKPLSTSYTQNDNSKQESDSDEANKPQTKDVKDENVNDEDNVDETEDSGNKEQEVQENETNTD